MTRDSQGQILVWGLCPRCGAAPETRCRDLRYTTENWPTSSVHANRPVIRRPPNTTPEEPIP